LDLFKFLIAKSGISASAISVHEQTLHSLLSSPVTSTVPGHPPGTTLPCLQVLHEKFTPTPYRTKGVGKKIQTAITTGSYAGLDLAAIIYSMRNWSLHGSAIGSSFRSVPRFKAFIATVLAALADVHHGIATELLKKV